MRLTHKLTPAIIVISLLLISLFSERWQYIRSDGEGYYAYLPAVFIYHDLTFQFADDIQKKYPKSYHPFRNEVNSKIVNKYFAGLAVLWLPFFLLAHLFSSAFGLETDGYSILYQKSVLVAALFYLWIGLIAFRKILFKMNFKEWQATIVTILIVFATPLFNYACYDPSFTHVYSFSLISLFVLHVMVYRDNQKSRYLYWAALFFGIIVILRPVNGLVVASLPFIAGDKNRLRQLLAACFVPLKKFFIALAIVGLVIVIQLLLWYLQTGHLLVWSYGNESFDFRQFHMHDALFSYRKGLFIYTPICFLALFGFLPLFRKSPWQFTWLLVILLLLVYVFSSWHPWWYGAGFSYRPMVDYLCYFGILMAFVARFKSMILKLGLGLLMVLAVPLNIVQTYQYNNYILHINEMDKEKYWEVFLITDQRFSGYIWKEKDLLKNRTVLSEKVFYNDFDRHQGWEVDDHLAEKPSFNGKACQVGNKDAYAGTFSERTGNLLEPDAKYVIRIGLQAHIENKDSQTRIVMTVDDSAGQNYYWSSHYLFTEIREVGKWKHASFDFEVPEIQSPADVMKIFLWNKGEDITYFDEVKIQVAQITPASR